MATLVCAMKEGTIELPRKAATNSRQLSSLSGQGEALSTRAALDTPIQSAGAKGVRSVRVHAYALRSKRSNGPRLA